MDDGSVFADRLQILFFDLSVPGTVSKDLKNAANWCKFIDGCTNPEVLEKLGNGEEICLEALESLLGGMD
ncbi:MAG: hypothetical protein K6G18_08975 [Treponema sp.]|nr:hypothetical protein [Treponema sp.]